MVVEPEKSTYSNECIVEYLRFISQRTPWKTFEDVQRAKELDPLQTLDWLQRKQMAAVPFGNVVLHYSQHHTISLDLQDLFHKLVRKKLGGYCLENNAFFAAVLRSIGYDVITTGGRVSRFVESRGKVRDGFTGWCVSSSNIGTIPMLTSPQESHGSLGCNQQAKIHGKEERWR